MATKRKWIQMAVQHPGRFTNWCKSHGFSGVNADCIAAAKKTGNKSVIGMATFAERARSKGGF